MHLRFKLDQLFWLASALVLACLAACGQQPEKVTPQTDSSPDVSNRILRGRATEAVIWGMPAVNYDLVYQAAIHQAHWGPNQIVFWSHFPDWKNQTHIGYVGIKRLGGGQFYLMDSKDKSSQPLSGANVYRLTVPAHAPVKQYWSSTVYDRATHTLIRNVQRASRASNDLGLQKNRDGSVDLYFAANAPSGKDSNWIPTDAKGKFDLFFRLYGPEPALFDKTWKLPDIEKTP